MDGVYMLDSEWVSTSFPNFLFYKLPLYASIMKLGYLVSFWQAGFVHVH